MALLLILLGYVVGAVPTGYLFGKLFFGIDITKQGSGNIGASNVARVLGKRYFFLIMFIDALKAFGLLVLGYRLGLPAWALYAAMATLLVGNGYSVFLRFSGGKGVATAFGIMLFALPAIIAAIFVACWALLIALTKKPFMASLGAMLTVLVCLGCWKAWDALWLMLAIAGWLLWRHRTNLTAWCSAKGST